MTTNLDDIKLADGWMIILPITDDSNEPVFRLTRRGGERCDTGRVVRGERHGEIVAYEPGGWTIAEGVKQYRVIQERQIVGVIQPQTKRAKPSPSQATTPGAALAGVKADAI